VDKKILASKAWEIWDNKVKPQLSLGKLEYVVVDIIMMVEELYPELGRAKMILFGGDHGIVNEKVTSSPQEITYQQCLNFAYGRGTINHLCRLNSIDLEIVDVGVNYDFDEDLPIINCKIAKGTKNFLKEKAMSETELQRALEVGSQRVLAALKENRKVVAFGEMGIGNTASSSALMASVTSISPKLCTGRGSGLTDEMLAKKIEIIEKALIFHNKPKDPLKALCAFGGFEIGAIVGSMLEAAKNKMVILVDGFIASTAALLATLIEPNTRSYMIFCHESNEDGHSLLLRQLNAQALLNLSMCLGEGSGAAIGWSIIKQAMNLYLNLESFEESNVTDSVALLKSKGYSKWRT